MAPKTIFSAEDVANAAFEVVRKNGFKDFTARRVAEELNSSTAPVYSCFRSMEELRQEVMKRGEKLVLEYTMRPYTKSVFLNMGTGLVLFAQENRELFRVLMLESGENRELLNHFITTLADELNRDELISLLPKKERRAVMKRMGVFAHGYAALLCAGILDDISKKTAIKTMYDMGRDVIDVALMKAGIKKSLDDEILKKLK